MASVDLSWLAIVVGRMFEGFVDMNELNELPTRRPGRPLLLAGVLIGLSGPVIGILLMFVAKRLITPWYAPPLGILSLALIVASLLRARSAWRWTATATFTLLLVFQCWALFAMRTPAYTGPVKQGRPFPQFATMLADGSAYTPADLTGGENTVMVFFRGHW